MIMSSLQISALWTLPPQLLYLNQLNMLDMVKEKKMIINVPYNTSI